MHAQSTPARITHHCFGIIMHHRLAWWLVEFPDLDATPLRARKLSGRLTPALADWLRSETGDASLPAEVTALHPDSRCWSGEFSCARAAGSDDLYDIDAHPWSSDAGELELRLARTMIDATIRPLPSGFTSVFFDLPSENQPVLAIRLSGYSCATFELMTARYMPTYRPRSPWRDISNDAVSDSGSDILGWREAADWIGPV